MTERTGGSSRLSSRLSISHCAALLIIMLVAVVPGIAQQSVPHPDLVVAEPVVNMHRHASENSDVVSQAIYGTGVTRLATEKGWYEIRTADNYTGWVAAGAVKALDGSTYAPIGKEVQVEELSANIYRDPDVTLHAPILRLPWEARLELAPDQNGRTGRWIHVLLVDGKTGWVQRGDVSTNAAPLTIPQMIDLSRRFLGTTYTWGGVSSFGFDCSGFTQMLERRSSGRARGPEARGSALLRLRPGQDHPHRDVHW